MGSTAVTWLSCVVPPPLMLSRSPGLRTTPAGKVNAHWNGLTTALMVPIATAGPEGNVKKAVAGLCAGSLAVVAATRTTIAGLAAIFEECPDRVREIAIFLKAAEVREKLLPIPDLHHGLRTIE